MRNRLIVTLSDIHGSKSYNLNKVIKKVILYVVVTSIIVFNISFFAISHLNDEVKNLSSQSSELDAQNKLYNLQIKNKIQELDALGETLKDIEEMIGVKGDDEATLIDRATLAKITSAQKSYMFQTIPSGSPLPALKPRVMSKFGWRIHPITKKKKHHNGIDLKAARRTDIFATADGIVKYVQDKNIGAFGRKIIIAHNFGFETLYAHMRFTYVKVGDVIKKGQLIAKSGNSGLSSGPHLHYEVRYANKVLDPKYFLSWNMKSYEKIFEKQRRVPWESLVTLIRNQNKKLAQQ